MNAPIRLNRQWPYPSNPGEEAFIRAHLGQSDRLPRRLCAIPLATAAVVSWLFVIGVGVGLAAFLGFMARLFLAYFGGL